MTAKYTLIEDAVDALKTYLSENMEAKVAAINAERDDDITLDDIKTYYVAEQQAIPEFPAILVLGDESAIDEQFGGLNGAHSVTVVVVAAEPDPETLRKKLYRYTRAVTELTIEARVNEGWEYIVRVAVISYSPLWTQGSGFMGDAQVKISMEKLEEGDY